MKETFTRLDYSLFFLMLAFNSGMGIYYGLYRKQKTANDFLLGGKQMSVVPTALSIITRYIYTIWKLLSSGNTLYVYSSLSGLILLSLPAEIYRYGITMLLISPLHIPVFAIACYVYIVVFYKLQVTSIYEYFKIRYDDRIRIFASFLYLAHMLLIPPVVIYIPALALSQGMFFTIFHYCILTSIYSIRSSRALHNPNSMRRLHILHRHGWNEGRSLVWYFANYINVRIHFSDINIRDYRQQRIR